MPTTLIIVESPTKSKAVASYAGPGHVARATFGHFRDLPEDELGVDVNDGFKPHYRITNRKTVQLLRQSIAKADRVILATDPDREGEAIAWHVTQVLKKELKGKRVARAAFHEITPQAVKEALAHPRQLDGCLVDAQQARRVLDRLVGYLVSRVLWRAFRGYRGLSAGRVQTAALRLVVERDREIAAFVPEEYWTLDAELSAPQSDTTFLARLVQIGREKADLKCQADVTAILTDLEGAAYTVADVKRQKKQRKPPPPFTTSTLQQAASGQWHWTPAKTMQIAQELFEGLDMPGEGHVGLITYMRTDSVHISPEAQQAARQVIAALYGDDTLPAEPPVYKTRSANAQEAHEAIRPTSPARLPDNIAAVLSPDQLALYRLIWQRFIASQMKPALYNVTTVDVTAQGREQTYRFRAVGRELLEPGFLLVYQEGEELDDMPQSPILPTMVQGDKLLCHRLIPRQHFTQPPPHYTEATLVKMMEQTGIGRPSTYAGIVATIQARGYVEKQDKVLRATPLGMQVCDYLVQHFGQVFDLGFTARMEERLDEVATGRVRWTQVVSELYEPLSAALRTG